jgi:hypothetical protein
MYVQDLRETTKHVRIAGLRTENRTKYGSSVSVYKYGDSTLKYAKTTSLPIHSTLLIFESKETSLNKLRLKTGGTAFFGYAYRL